MSRHEKAPIAPTTEAHEAERKSTRKNVMTNHSTAVTVDNLPALMHAGRPVVTTALLARLYGTEDAYITKNLSRNRDRFIDGKHYFKLEGPELKALKDYTSQRHVVDIPKNTRQLILWTERGAARHAKMLDTEEAWDVFEKLEDSYFGKMTPVGIEHKADTLTPAHQRHILNRVAELAGMDRKKYPSVWRGIKDHFKVGSYKDIPDSQYPAVCAFMLCKPLDEELPTARIIEDRHRAQQRLDIHFPIESLTRRRPSMLTQRGNGQAWLDVTIDDLRDMRGDETPLERLLWQLEREGYDVKGAWWELRTYRNKLRELCSFAIGMGQVVSKPHRYAVDGDQAA
jgi:hypothetical protein